MGRRIGDDSPAEALHDLRKKGKELRYLLEFFASLYAADVVKPMVSTLKGLQDVLGRFQDREVLLPLDQRPAFSEQHRSSQPFLQKQVRLTYDRARSSTTA